MLKYKKYAVPLFILFILILVADYAIKAYLSNDLYLSSIEEFVASSPDIIREYGNLSKMKLKKLTKINGSNNKKPYRLYAILIEGERNSGIVEIHASNLNPDKKIGDYRFRNR